jgi:DNA replication protein DnaC
MNQLKIVEADPETKQDNCPEHGSFIARRVNDWNEWTDCPACIAARAARDRQEAFTKAMERACMPTRFYSKGLETYKAVNEGQKEAMRAARNYCSNFKSCRENGTCMVFTGTPGTGKTHLALGIVKQVISAGYTCRYTRAFELIEAIRATWRRDSKTTEKQILQAFTEVDLLVLDEVGVQYGTESETVELFKVLDTRYLDVKPSIILTNVSRIDLQNYLGARAFDRLKEGGGMFVQFTWESFRH